VVAVHRPGETANGGMEKEETGAIKEGGVVVQTLAVGRVFWSSSLRRGDALLGGFWGGDW
jgi:hypothetical protein